MLWALSILTVSIWDSCQKEMVLMCLSVAILYFSYRIIYHSDLFSSCCLQRCCAESYSFFSSTIKHLHIFNFGWLMENWLSLFGLSLFFIQLYVNISHINQRWSEETFFFKTNFKQVFDIFVIQDVDFSFTCWPFEKSTSNTNISDRITCLIIKLVRIETRVTKRECHNISNVLSN